jgi:uncharacterized protein YndB with AHSA1/START domain
MKRIIGRTKDAGFQFGIRRTFPVSQESAWEFLFSEMGLALWLGLMDQPLMYKSAFVTLEGIEGVVTVIKPLSHVRMAWKKKSWQNTSRLQVRLIPNNGKTTISFHHEKLMDAAQREEMKTYWGGVMDKLSGEIVGFDS